MPASGSTSRSASKLTAHSPKSRGARTPRRRRFRTLPAPVRREAQRRLARRRQRRPLDDLDATRLERLCEHAALPREHGIVGEVAKDRRRRRRVQQHLLRKPNHGARVLQPRVAVLRPASKQLGDARRARAGNGSAGTPASPPRGARPAPRRVATPTCAGRVCRWRGTSHVLVRAVCPRLDRVGELCTTLRRARSRQSRRGPQARETSSR